MCKVSATLRVVSPYLFSHPHTHAHTPTFDNNGRDDVFRMCVPFVYSKHSHSLTIHASRFVCEMRRCQCQLHTTQSPARTAHVRVAARDSHARTHTKTGSHMFNVSLNRTALHRTGATLPLAFISIMPTPNRQRPKLLQDARASTNNRRAETIVWHTAPETQTMRVL